MGNAGRGEAGRSLRGVRQVQARLEPVHVRRMVLSWSFATAMAVVGAWLATVWLAAQTWPGEVWPWLMALGLAGHWAIPKARAALDQAAARAVAQSPEPAGRPPIVVQAPVEPVSVAVARAMRIRVAAWSALALAGIAAAGVDLYLDAGDVGGPDGVAMPAMVGAVALALAWRVRRTLRRQAGPLQDAAQQQVTVVGFTDPLARGLVLQPADGGRRLAVPTAWAWRQDLAVGDVLTLIGRPVKGAPGRIGRGDGPGWVLCLPGRSHYLTAVTAEAGRPSGRTLNWRRPTKGSPTAGATDAQETPAGDHLTEDRT